MTENRTQVRPSFVGSEVTPRKTLFTPLFTPVDGPIVVAAHPVPEPVATRRHRERSHSELPELPSRSASERRSEMDPRTLPFQIGSPQSGFGKYEPSPAPQLSRMSGARGARFEMEGGKARGYLTSVYECRGHPSSGWPLKLPREAHPYLGTPPLQIAVLILVLEKTLPTMPRLPLGKPPPNLRPGSRTGHGCPHTARRNAHRTAGRPTSLEALPRALQSCPMALALTSQQFPPGKYPSGSGTEKSTSWGS